MGLEQEIEKRVFKLSDDDIEKRQQFIINIIIGQMERSQHYVSVLIAGSYIAFFTSWAGVQSDLPFFERFFSMMLMSMSLTFFIGWEICKMIKRAFLVKRQIEIAQATPNDFEKMLPYLVKKEENYNLLNEKIWPGILVLTIIPAIMSATVFFVGCFKVLFYS